MKQRKPPASTPASRLPPDGEQGQLLLPDGDVMPVRVAESADGVLSLVQLLKPLPPPGGDEGAPVLEWRSSAGIVRLRGTATWEESDLVRFEVQETVDVQQRREHVRVHAPRPVVLDADAVGAELGTFAIDLSGGGVLLAGPATLQIGDEVRFRLLLDGSESVVEGTGQVVRYGSGGERALAFADVSEADRERLIRIIFRMQRAAARVRRDGDSPGATPRSS